MNAVLCSVLEDERAALEGFSQTSAAMERAVQDINETMSGQQRSMQELLALRSPPAGVDQVIGVMVWVLGAETQPQDWGQVSQ